MYQAILWLTLNTFSLDDVDGDGKRSQNREADCQSNAGLHSDTETFVRVDACKQQSHKNHI